MSSKLAADIDGEVTLGLLNAVDRNEALTQRSLAEDLGVALGMANAYLKRCVKIGYIKISQAPANRYAYYLTPKGFAEKSRLTAEFLSQSFKFVRLARQEFSTLIEHQIACGKGRIAVFGDSDLTEIFVMCVRETSANLVGVVVPGGGDLEISNLTLVEAVSDLQQFDLIVVADLNDPQGCYDNLTNLLGSDRVYGPELLNISQRATPQDSADGVQSP